ncbi:unnamed protein product, partial [Linum tenue]
MTAEKANRRVDLPTPGIEPPTTFFVAPTSGEEESRTSSRASRIATTKDGRRVKKTSVAALMPTTHLVDCSALVETVEMNPLRTTSKGKIEQRDDTAPRVTKVEADGEVSSGTEITLGLQRPSAVPSATVTSTIKMSVELMDASDVEKEPEMKTKASWPPCPLRGCSSLGESKKSPPMRVWRPTKKTKEKRGRHGHRRSLRKSQKKEAEQVRRESSSFMECGNSSSITIHPVSSPEIVTGQT